MTKSYCARVKVAITIADLIDRAARRLGISLSELYACALERYHFSEADDELTARLDRVYSHEYSRLDPALRLAQRRALGGGE